MRKLYEWILAISKTRSALGTLCLISFTESFIFPIPPDFLLIPIALSNQKKALWAGTLTLIFSILGAIVGYALGFWLYQELMIPLIEFYGYQEKIQNFFLFYNDWGWWFVIGAGFTPFPYKIITILSGAAELNFISFIVASIISRGARFYLVSGLIYLYGEKIKRFIEKFLPWLTTFAFLLIFALVLILKYA